MPSLQGMVAVVTGASRGAGRGIAMVLGEAGATVYVTGRSVRDSSTRSDLPGTTIDDTAAMVTARGGVGIPVRVDHTNDAEIARLFERVKREQGRLDLLVNNAWGGYADDSPETSFDAVFWEQPVHRWDTMIQAGVRATLVTTHAALPLMLPRRSGLIVNMTLDIAPDHYDRALFYLSAKATINYLTRGMAYDLNQRSHIPITVVGLSPGWMRTEAVMGGVFPHTLPTPERLHETESVEYSGRAIVALATDPHVLSKSGHILSVRSLAREYSFTDIDGRQPA